MSAQTTTHTSETLPGPEAVAESRERNNLGMWLFLISEIMLFGGLFLSYTIYRMNYTQAFIEGSRHLNVTLGTVNTAVLLTSSLCMAFAVYYGRQNRVRIATLLLYITALLGVVFLGLKGYEYYTEYQEGLVPLPDLAFSVTGPHAEQVRLFFNLYFIMTGLHAIHLVIGVLLVATTPFLARIRPFKPDPGGLVEIVGLFWHFIDVVWVFIFPLLYLIDRAGG